MSNGTLNKVMLIGHTGDDVKMHYFEGGNCLGRFPLATNETYINKTTNERVTNTEWHNIIVRNKAAEICEKYLKKGDLVYIEGKLKTRKWQDENGLERYSTEIQCLDFNFLSSKGDSNSSSSGANPMARSQASDSGYIQPQGPGSQDENTDLPF